MYINCMFKTQCWMYTAYAVLVVRVHHNVSSVYHKYGRQISYIITAVHEKYSAGNMCNTQYQQQVPHIMPAACTNHNDSHRFHKLLYIYIYIYI